MNINAQKIYLDCVRFYPQIIEHSIFALTYIFYLIKIIESFIMKWLISLGLNI